MDTDTISVLQAQVAQSININPAVVTISRKTRVKTTGGGYRTTGSTSVSETIRLYRISRTAEPSRNVQIPGVIEQRHYGLIADYNADIAADDEFTYNNIQYRIGPIENQTLNGSTVISKHAKVERIE